MEFNLYIVGTPIGNLRDITLRALETLKKVDVIACEDTRVTRKLLNHYEIKNKTLIAYHDKNEKNSATGILELTRSGKKVAVVSDAGMPAMADPGFEIIRRAKNEGVAFEVIPGVSAHVITAAISSLDSHYKFLGFLSPKTGKRKNEISKLVKGTYVTYVSPYKLVATLQDIISILGEKTNVFLAKELTKLHEKHFEGTAIDVYEKVKNSVKGEYTLMFEVNNVTK